MARAMQEIKVGDNVFVNDPTLPITYGKVKDISNELYTVEALDAVYEVEPGFLELDELPF